MEHLVTLTQWSMKLDIALVYTTYFEAYRRLTPAMMLVWKLNPQWRLETCVPTPIPPQSLKNAMILNQAMKPAAISTSRTPLSTTTWATQVSLDLLTNSAFNCGKFTAKLKEDYNFIICWVYVHIKPYVEFCLEKALKNLSKGNILLCFTIYTTVRFFSLSLEK